MKVHLLDENTINMIAAGEVIENPSNVVKELVENAIDASAHNIVIEVSSDICSLIKVVDDGCGFDKDDIKISFYKHATSKLTKISDLYSIDSYGFRGEALSSIASVSDVTLITKKDGDKGYKYNISFGKEKEIEETAANNGTTFIIKNLFYNTPVRKKFLKSDQREVAAVYDVIEKMSYTNTDISFAFIVDGRQRFKTPGDGNLKNVIYEIYGKEIYEQLIEIDDIVKDIRVNGFIAKPIVTRNNKNDIIYFVNKRYVRSKIITKAIEDSYSTYLMQHKYPLCVLDIEIQKDVLDINVHPKKEEVRFESDDIVYYAIYNAVYKTLNSISLIHEEKLSCDDVYDKGDLDDSINVENFEKNVGNDLDSLESLSAVKIDNLFSKLEQKVITKSEERPFIQKTLTEDHKYIGQVFNTYILVEFDDKLYIIDQHAAHEKINFENLMGRYKKGEDISQKIFPSIIVKLSPKQYSIVSENIDSFCKIGYDIELFGDTDIKIAAVPYNLLGIGKKEMLLDIIDSFSDLSSKEKYESVIEKIASISCKKAIKANYVLSENEVKSLLRELFKLDNPYNCPHGRPTIISLSKYEFEKKFGRIV